MVLTAMRGALGFLTRLPVGRDERAWATFLATPATFPAVGYVVGGLAVLPLLLPTAAPTTTLLFVLGLYLVAGINHVDGLADLGDALVVHGDAGERLAAMGDTTLGVGGTLAVALVVLGLGLAGLALAGGGLQVVLLVVSAEVGAKLAMATVACLGRAAHEGLGSALSSRHRPRSLALPALLALPAAGLTWPHPAAAVALAAGPLSALVVLAWARHSLGGITGDAIGATNEVARVVALHAGVIAWTNW